MKLNQVPVVIYIISQITYLVVRGTKPYPEEWEKNTPGYILANIYFSYV